MNSADVTVEALGLEISVRAGLERTGFKSIFTAPSWRNILVHILQLLSDLAAPICMDVAARFTASSLLSMIGLNESVE